MYRTRASCVLSCVVEGRECETRRNGTDNSRLGEGEGEGEGEEEGEGEGDDEFKGEEEV